MQTHKVRASPSCEHPQQAGCGVLDVKISFNVQSLIYMDFLSQLQLGNLKCRLQHFFGEYSWLVSFGVFM